MDKVKLMKKITAVAASAAMVVSGAFAATLADFPNNYVQNNKFIGQVVIGAHSQDQSTAMYLINSLQKRFSGQEKMYKITATKTEGGSGEKVLIDNPGSELNYGEDFGDVRSYALDDSDLKILDDGTFDNGAEDQDYTQEITLAKNTGYFEHSLRDDYENNISDHIYLTEGAVANYTLEFKSPIHYDPDTLDKDFVGKDIKIMGKDFTITGVGSNFDYIEMIGGANKINLGEGESTTVTVDGQTYNVEVVAVSSGDPNEVLVKVNGQTKSIDEYDTDTVAGITVGVTDAFPSSRDSVKGYATLVVGGQKIRLDKDGEVKINDQNIGDLYDNYEAYSKIDVDTSTDELNGFTVEYKLDDDAVLEKGQSWKDRVFDAFSILYGGNNDVNYSEIKVEEDNDKLRLEGKTVKGDDFNEDIAELDNDEDANSYIHLMGRNDDDSFVVENISAGVLFGGDLDVSTTPLVKEDNKLGVQFNITNAVINSTNKVTNVTLKVNEGSPITINGLNSTNSKDFTADNYLFTVKEGSANNTINILFDGIDLSKADGFRTLVGDKDNQELWEFKTYTASSNEIDVKDILSGDEKDDIAEKDIGSGKITDLYSDDTTEDGVLTQIKGTFPKLAMDNNALVDLSGVNGIAGTSKLTFSLDKQDLTADDDADLDGVVVAKLKVDTTNNEFDVKLDTSDSNFVTYPSGASPDISSDNSDVQEYVTKYGIKVRYDNQDERYLDVYVPDKEVQADVYLVAGNGGNTETQTYTVTADQLDAKKAELEKEGYSVQVEELSSSNVEFDLNNYVTDADVTAQDHNLIVIGGPAVNKVAADLLGIPYGTTGDKGNVGVNPGEAIVKYYNNTNTILAYGWSAADTKRAVEALLENKVSGTEQKV